ncbi:MAG: histidine kinase [Bacteroidetes bacterium]|nr:histidine kinase [Bacteroidota bacterium]
MEKLNDKWLRIGGITILNLFLNIFFYLDLVHVKHIPFLKVFLLSTAYVIISWEVTRFVILLVRKKFPGILNTRKRIINLGIYVTAATLAISLLKVEFISGVDFYNMGDTPQDHPVIFEYLYSFGMNMFYALIITGIYESLYFFNQWRKSFSEMEQLRKANLQSQFDSLKNQVNPHFLFNSLNSLSSLVEEDKEKAVQFIAELSRVYRYLLQTNEKELTTLSAELEFIQAYYFLLQTRFGNGVKLVVDVFPSFRDFLIPPLTLQILVENAVKHNVVSTNKPLIIRISTDALGNLMVDNNLQKKTQSVPSGGMGLANITSKYKLLNQSEVMIRSTDDNFQVKLPLISPQMPYDPFEAGLSLKREVPPSSQPSIQL